MSSSYIRWTRLRDALAASKRALATAKRAIERKTRIRDNLAAAELGAYRAVESERAITNPGFDALPPNVLERISDFACADAASRTAIKSVCVQWNRYMPSRVIHLDFRDLHIGDYEFKHTLRGNMLLSYDRERSHVSLINLVTRKTEACTRSTRLVTEDTILRRTSDDSIVWSSRSGAHATIEMPHDRLHDMLHEHNVEVDFLWHFSSEAVGIATCVAYKNAFVIVDARENRMAVLRHVDILVVVHVSSALIVLLLKESLDYHIYSIRGTLLLTLSRRYHEFGSPDNGDPATQHHDFMFDLPEGDLVFVDHESNACVTVSPSGETRSRICNKKILRSWGEDHYARVSPNRRYFVYRSENGLGVCRTSDFREVASYSLYSLTQLCINFAINVSIDDEGRVFLAAIDNFTLRCNVFACPSIRAS